MRPPPSLTATLTSLAVASAVLTGAGSASAADFVIDLPAGAACADFGLRVEGIVGRNHTRTFVDENGNPVRIIMAGTGSALTFTNMSSGEQLALRSNGAVQRTVFHGDGTRTVTDTGHNVLILFPTDVGGNGLPEKVPSTNLVVGRLVFDVDAAEVFSVRSVSGRTVNICAVLAG